MSTSTTQAVRCPRCSAHLRAGSEWCTLCYADLRPAPEPPPATAAPDPAPVDLPPLPAADPASAVDQPAPRRGKHARRVTAEDLGPDPADGAPAAGSDVDADRLADQLLAELAASQGGNPLGPLAGAVDTTGKKVALMVGGTAVGIVLLFVLMAVAGALL